MEPDHISEDSYIAYETHYCSVAEAMKLITHPFDGDKKRLREFIENVDVAFELVHPNKHDILLKFVKTKITGDARSKLILRDLTHTWALVKVILEENYALRRTLDFYACRNFSARQEKGENDASWGIRNNEMQTELREAVRRVCKPEEIQRAVGLIGNLGMNASYKVYEVSGFKRTCYRRLWKYLWMRNAPSSPFEKNLEPVGTP